MFKENKCFKSLIYFSVSYMEKNFRLYNRKSQVFEKKRRPQNYDVYGRKIALSSIDAEVFQFYIRRCSIASSEYVMSMGDAHAHYMHGRRPLGEMA